MRFRLLLLCLPALLGACAKTNAPVQLDFIGTGSLTSGNRTASPNDTIITRLYAIGHDNPLKRLRITVTYTPGLTPIVYPLPLSSYDTKNAPAALTLTYLDSLLAPLAIEPTGHEYLFVNQLTARATSGTELWQYTATDTQESSATRAYRLTVRKSDSAAVYHSYTTQLRPIPANSFNADAKKRARVFVNLAYGLLLPKFALVNREASVQNNQQLVDVLCVTTATGSAVSLSTPEDASVISANSASWPAANRRATQLRRTGLTSSNFTSAATAADFDNAFAAGTDFLTNKYSTGTLAKDQVIAFKTADGKAGLLLVSELVLGSAPVLTCSVKVQK